MGADDSTRVATSHAAERFRAEWGLGGRPQISSYLPLRGEDRLACLKNLVIADLRQRLDIEEDIDVTSYFREFPEMAIQKWAWEVLAERFSCATITERDVELHRIRCELADVVDQYENQLAKVDDAATRRVSPDLSLQPGQRVGDFELIRQVGQGAHGRVFLAREVGLDRYVALKISKSRGREGQLLAKLNHPNIVRVFREQTVGERKLLAMEFVVGRTLQEWCDAIGSRRTICDSDHLLRLAGSASRLGAASRAFARGPPSRH